MNEYLVSLIIYAVFLIATLAFRKRVVKVKSPWLCLLYIVLYFVFTDLYFEFLNKMHQILRDHQIYIEYGHASIFLLEVFAICVITCLITTISIIFTRRKQKRFLN